jgi:hypothetical protein
MKAKNFSKKLKLNKKTVANLNNGEMEAVHGGGGNSAPWTNCPSCMITRCGCPTTSGPPGFCC